MLISPIRIDEGSGTVLVMVQLVTMLPRRYRRVPMSSIREPEGAAEIGVRGFESMFSA